MRDKYEMNTKPLTSFNFSFFKYYYIVNQKNYVEDESCCGQHTICYIHTCNVYTQY